MTEIGAIVGIYGAIDQVAWTDENARAAVSVLLPLYRDPDLHWFDDFEAWLREKKAKAAGRLFPSLDDALRDLAELDPGRSELDPPPRVSPRRRLFAIAVAMQAFPDMRDPETERGGLAVGALRVITPAAEDEQAQALHGLVAEDASRLGAEAGPKDLSSWWSGLVTTADTHRLISSTTCMFPRPCSGQLVNVPGAGQAAALRTEFETGQIAFNQATRFIEPTNWETCMSWFWCEMTPLGAGLMPDVHRYREVVSSDCASKATAAFFAETELEFNFMWLPDATNPVVALTNYQLSSGRPHPGDLIVVDEGSLLVAKTGPGQTPLRITTTKRIMFSRQFTSKELAIIMCAFGYADAVADLLCCAASGSQPGTAFPGIAPASPQRTATPNHACAAIPRNVGAAVGDCIEECMVAAGDWSRRVAQGPYTAEEFAQDMASTWARALRKGATAINVGSTGSQTGTHTPTRERTEG
jgi:hypothetical protein